MSDDIGFFSILALICVVVFGGIVGVGYVAGAYQCGERARMMRLQHNFGLMTGCMVDTGDRWAPIEYIRIVDGKVSIQGNGE